MAKRIEAFYGGPGSGKSEAAASVVEQIFVQDGLKSRALIGDGSRATYADRGLIDAGIIEVVDFSIREWPLTTMSQLCEGYWPADVNDPKSPLLPPTPASLQNLGVVVIEGISVMSQYIMGDVKGGLAEQAGRGIKIGQDSPVRSTDILFDEKTGLPIKNSGPGTSFGGNPISHYGYAQRRVLANIERTKVFPNVVIWTAHEKSTADKISGEKLVGLEAAGEAMTANLTRHFNNTLHFVGAANAKEKKKDDHTEALVKELDTEFRIYTRDHFHPDGTTFVKYKAVSRGGMTEALGMPLYLTSNVPGKSILEFYQIIANAKGSRMAEILARRAEVEAKVAA